VLIYLGSLDSKGQAQLGVDLLARLVASGC
jgi:hypothetical protein